VIPLTVDHKVCPQIFKRFLSTLFWQLNFKAEIYLKAILCWFLLFMEIICSFTHSI
jgi:hypothetical protein